MSIETPEGGPRDQRGASEAEQSIAMSSEDEAAYARQAGEAGEPADEGVGALTDDEGQGPRTDN